MGETLAGKFLLMKVLGVGGMGAVYRARHAITEDEVALKVLFPDMASHPGIVERFLREARAASRIRHPGIVRVLDAGAEPDNGDIWLAMELLEGEDLASAIDHGGISTEVFLGYVIELLDVLGAAHERRWVHRDIKPENLFLLRQPDGSSRLKVLDFGIARDLGSEGKTTTAGSVLGTPYYMAPEQARGEPVDHRADLWAVGALVYHAFGGAPPFDGDNANMVMFRVMSDEPKPLRELCPGLHEGVYALVRRALMKNPADRWQSAEAMAEVARSALACPPDDPRLVALASTLRAKVPPSAGSLATSQVTASSFLPPAPPTRRIKAAVILGGVALAAASYLLLDRAPTAVTTAAIVPPTRIAPEPTRVAPPARDGSTAAPPAPTSPNASGELHTAQPHPRSRHGASAARARSASPVPVQQPPQATIPAPAPAVTAPGAPPSRMSASPLKGS